MSVNRNISEGSLRRKRTIRSAVAIVVVTVGLILSLLSYVGLFNGNVRIVEQGQVYRSAQLVSPQLDDVLRRNGIRTVINLRGYLPDDRRLRNEMRVCQQMGIKHIDISMSAEKLPKPLELHKLIVALKTSQRPLLIHCAGGSDRTGLACTLYRHICQQIPLNRAEHDQLTWRYGHIWFGSAHPMDDFFNMYRNSGNGMPIEKWADTVYPSEYLKTRK